MSELKCPTVAAVVEADGIIAMIVEIAMEEEEAEGMIFSDLIVLTCGLIVHNYRRRSVSRSRSRSRYVVFSFAFNILTR